MKRLIIIIIGLLFCISAPAQYLTTTNDIANKLFGVGFNTNTVGALPNTTVSNSLLFSSLPVTSFPTGIVNISSAGPSLSFAQYAQYPSNSTLNGTAPFGDLSTNVSGNVVNITSTNATSLASSATISPTQTTAAAMCIGVGLNTQVFTNGTNPYQQFTSYLTAGGATFVSANNSFSNFPPGLLMFAVQFQPAQQTLSLLWDNIYLYQNGVAVQLVFQRRQYLTSGITIANITTPWFYINSSPTNYFQINYSNNSGANITNTTSTAIYVRYLGL